MISKKTYIPAKPRNRKLVNVSGGAVIGRTDFNQVAGSSHEHPNKVVIDQILQQHLDVLGVLSIVEGNLKIDANAYSTGELSAYGLGSVGSSGDGGSISTLSDVQLTSPIPGNILQFNGTHWINIPFSPVLSWDDIINKPTTLAGYGIIDAAPISHSNISGESTIHHTHTNKSIINQITQDNIEVLAKLSVVNGNLQIDGNAYSTGELSAYGLGSGGSGGGGSISTLSDVLLSSLVSGQILRFNGTHWVNETFNPVTSWAHITDKPSTFTPSAHTHAISDIINLQTTLDAKLDITIFNSHATNSVANVKHLTDAQLTYLNNLISWWKLDASGNLYTDKNLYSTLEVSAYGIGSGGSSGGGVDLLQVWTDYDSAKDNWAVKAGLLVPFYDDTRSRLTALEGGAALSLSVTGTGNAVASLTKSGTVLTVTKANFAELDVNGKILSSQLPSYVDDVLEYVNLAAFPATGETGKIYIAQDSNKTYRWSGTAYVEISASLALGETSSTAYRGDRGKIAYDHSQLTGNPHGTTFAQIVSRPTTITGYGITDAYTKTEVNSALTLKLDKSVFDDLFEKVEVSTGVFAIKAKYNFYGVGEISAYGLGTGGSGGGSYDRLDTWASYDSTKSGWVLSALLGVDLNTRIGNLEGGSALTINTTGTGNAITSISKAGTVITATKGTTFSLDNHVHTGVYEPVFTKNTAFNKNFGTTAGTVAEGNDSRLSDARTPLAHNHNASDINAGVLTIARIPTGTTGTTVALGNHLHTGIYEPVLGNPSTNGYLLSSTTGGTRSWVAPYSLPTASASVLGGVKIGANISISSGVISVHNPVTIGTANGLSLSTQALSLALATTAANGALSATDKTYIELLKTFFEYDSANNAIKALKSFYSTGEISAYGLGTGVSGGGSYDRLDAWVDYDSTKSGWVLSALLGVDLNTRVGNLEGGSALTVNTTGTGNAITSISKAGTVITATKGATFSLDNHLHAGIYEPVFAKNTAFNKNFGTVAGTVAEGNHTHTFASLTSKPTTLAGYGITDAVTTNTSQTISGAKTFSGTITITGAAIDSPLKVRGIEGRIDSTGLLDALYLNFVSTKDIIMVNGGGNVGIGNVSPAYKLDVTGTGRFTGMIDSPSFNQTNALGGLIHQVSATTGNLSQVWALGATNQLTSETTPNASFFGIATRYVSPNRWYEWYGAGILAARIGLHSGDAYFKGNVGIGNISPAYKLDVNGTGRFTGALTAAVSVTTPKVIFAAAGWSVEQSGTEIQFKYNGAIKQRLLSDGSIVSVGEITAFGLTT